MLRNNQNTKHMVGGTYKQQQKLILCIVNYMAQEFSLYSNKTNGKYPSPHSQRQITQSDVCKFLHCVLRNAHDPFRSVMLFYSTSHFNFYIRTSDFVKFLFLFNSYIGNIINRGKFQIKNWNKICYSNRSNSIFGKNMVYRPM